MKDNLLREVSSQMEELNEHLKKFENNLDLKKLPHLDGFGVSLQEAPLPEELVERCARLSLKPSTPTELADSLQGKKSHAGSILVKVKSILYSKKKNSFE